VIQPHDLPDEITAAPPGAAAAPSPASDRPPPAALSDDAALLVSYLRAARWNVSAVARQLGVARMTLYRRMRRYGIEPPRG
jgi:transcriptional regulator of acetoin/glycerol metabolism